LQLEEEPISIGAFLLKIAAKDKDFGLARTAY
jgi:hypothetical protein